MKILIAEKNVINLFLTKTYLKNIISQASIIKTKDGTKALKKYQKESSHFILMDIQILHLNSIEEKK